MNKNAKILIASLVISVEMVVLGYGAKNHLNEVNSLNNQINALNDENNEIKLEIDIYKSEIESKNNEIESLNQQIDEITSELEYARQKIEEYNRIVVFNQHNVKIVSNATLEHMQRALSGTGLYQDCQSFIDAEKTYGVNAFFIAAIAAQESGWGTSERAIYQNNLTGHAVYNSGARGTYFNSRYESIMNTAELLKNEYLTPGGSCYNGNSIVDVNKKYCFLEDKITIDYNWSLKIAEIAEDLAYKANDFEKI